MSLRTRVCHNHLKQPKKNRRNPTSPRDKRYLSIFRGPIFPCNGWFLWWTPRTDSVVFFLWVYDFTMNGWMSPSNITRNRWKFSHHFFQPFKVILGIDSFFSRLVGKYTRRPTNMDTQNGHIFPIPFTNKPSFWGIQPLVFGVVCSNMWFFFASNMRNHPVLQ